MAESDFVAELRSAAVGRGEEVGGANNYAAAAAELRAQIAHQVSTANALDTKLSALIAAVGVVASVVGGRLILDNVERDLAFGLSAILAVIVVVVAFDGLRPRAIHFGGNVADVVRLAREDVEAVYTLELVYGLQDAYDLNQPQIEKKGTRYLWSVSLFAAALVSVGLLIASGAFK